MALIKKYDPDAAREQAMAATKDLGKDVLANGEQEWGAETVGIAHGITHALYRMLSTFR